MNGTKQFSIGQVAKAGGVNLQTIRLYERRGLLPKPPRSASGYRVFPPESVSRVRFIKRAQELGFALAQVKELLALRLDAGADCVKVRERAEAKLGDIEQKSRDLRQMQAALSRLIAARPGRGSIGGCPILETLELGTAAMPSAPSPTRNRRRLE